MRSLFDRVRHTVIFEIMGLIIVAPIVSILFGKSLATTALLAISLSLIAMLWNGFYNWIFDRVLLKLNKSLYPRSVRLRALHAITFEVVLTAITLPLIAIMLEISLLQALAADIGFVLFFMVYAFVYNWVYDVVFPVGV